MKTDKNDPIGQALLDAGAGMGRPKRTISDGMGGERELSDAEFARYQSVAGQYVREDIQDAIADPEWKMLDQTEQRKEIKRIVAAARRDAREDLFSDDAQLPPLPPGFVMPSS